MSTDDVNSHFQAIRGIIVDLEEEIKSRNDELAAISEREQEARDALAWEEQTLADKKKAVAEETGKLDTEFAVYRKEVETLKAEVAILVERKGVLQTSNSQLEQDNRAFKAYEKKAWQALRAKDEDLQARERNTREKESMSPAAVTFLPPV